MIFYPHEPQQGNPQPQPNFNLGTPEWLPGQTVQFLALELQTRISVSKCIAIFWVIFVILHVVFDVYLGGISKMYTSNNAYYLVAMHICIILSLIDIPLRIPLSQRLLQYRLERRDPSFLFLIEEFLQMLSWFFFSITCVVSYACWTNAKPTLNEMYGKVMTSFFISHLIGLVFRKLWPIILCIAAPFLVCLCIPISYMFQWLTPGPGASRRQLKKLPIHKYDVENPSNIQPRENECSICITKYNQNEEYRILPCGHSFHKSCIDTWLKKKAVCPICRRWACPENERAFNAAQQREVPLQFTGMQPNIEVIPPSQPAHPI